MKNQKKIRSLLKKTEDKFISVRTVMQVLKLNTELSLRILVYLEEQGFIEKSVVDERYWIVSVRGKILAHKVIAKEFKETTLKKHVTDLLQRASVVNASAKYPVYIRCIKIISKYSIEQGAGIYIAYSLSSKPITEKEYNAAANELRKQYRGSLVTIIQYYGYPEKAVLNFLKSRSNVLKLKRYNAEDIKRLEGDIIFGEPQG